MTNTNASQPVAILTDLIVATRCDTVGAKPCWHFHTPDGEHVGSATPDGLRWRFNPASSFQSRLAERVGLDEVRAMTIDSITHIAIAIAETARHEREMQAELESKASE